MKETRPYVCGHTPREHERLDIQGALYADITRRAMVEAGVEPGMRVLDLGCGTGSVSFLAAEIVGTEGSVAGIDRDPAVLEAARRRADVLGTRNVTFHEAAIGPDGDNDPDGGDTGSAALTPGSFDVLVGRFVLMHQPDPAATLARATRLVAPGGAVVFVESVMAALLEGFNAEPPCPVYERVVRWTCSVVGAAGADLRAGLHLRDTFTAAGLPAPSTRLEAPVEGGEDSLLYRYCAENVRSMLPLAERMGIAGFSADTADTLEGKLRTASVEGGHTLVAWPVVAALASLPPA